MRERTLLSQCRCSISVLNVLVFGGVSNNKDWARIYYAAEDVLELLKLLILTPKGMNEPTKDLQT